MSNTAPGTSQPGARGVPDKPGARGVPDKPGARGVPDKPGARGVPDRLVGMELIPGEDADAVAAAARDVNPDVKVDRQPHVTVVEAPGRLEIDPVRVREHLGRDWGADDLQVIMASYFGFISRWEEDGIVLEWMRATQE